MNHKLFATAGWPRLVSPSPAKVAKFSKLPNLPPQLQSKHLSHLGCLSPVSPVTSRKRLKFIAEEFLCVVNKPTVKAFGVFVDRAKQRQSGTFGEYMTTFSQEGLEIFGNTHGLLAHLQGLSCLESTAK